MLRSVVLVCAGSTAFTLAQAATSTTAAAYASNSDLSLRLSPIAGPVKGATSGSGTTLNITIDDTKNGYKQNITGFGAAVTDATVININGLSSANQTQLLKELMTTTNSDTSAGFSMMRHTIGSSDLSPEVYTYDDTSSPDQNLTQFDITDRGRAMAALLAKMKGINSNLFILGSAWSPPGWMKQSGQVDEPNYRAPGATDCTTGDPKNRLSDRYVNSSEPDYTQSYAQYFVKYLQAFQNNSVHVDAITIQNEPLNNNSCYPTMYMNGSEAGLLINNAIGPALAQAKLNTQIWGLDDDNHKNDIASAQATVDIAGKYVNTIGWHCYYPDKTKNWTVLTDFHDSNLKKGVNVRAYMTECGTPPPSAGGNWYGSAAFTIGPLQNWAKGVTAWTLSAQPTTDSSGQTTYGPHLSTGGCSSCRGLVSIYDNGTITYNVAYYGMAQFSRFIPPGATILNGTGSTSDITGIQSVGSLNPNGSRTVVVLNTGADDLFVNLKTGSGEQWGGTVPKKSVTTWVLPKVG